MLPTVQKLSPPTRASELVKSLSASAIRKQIVLSEILQPPLSLRE
jgi:hypothetical protein